MRSDGAPLRRRRVGRVSATAACAAALALAQIACGAALIYETSRHLIYDSPLHPHKRCRLSSDVQDMAPCGYAIALGAVSIAGCALLLGALLLDYVLATAMQAAEAVATQVGARSWPSFAAPA